MRRWFGVFTMGSAHDLCPGRRSETHGSKDPPLKGRQPFPCQEQRPGSYWLLVDCDVPQVHGFLGECGVDASNLRILPGFLLSVQLSFGEKFGGKDLGLHDGDSRL